MLDKKIEKFFINIQATDFLSWMFTNQLGAVSSPLKQSDSFNLYINQLRLVN